MSSHPSNLLTRNFVIVKGTKEREIALVFTHRQLFMFLRTDSILLEELKIMPTA
jgi:hypothetical protein